MPIATLRETFAENCKVEPVVYTAILVLPVWLTGDTVFQVMIGGKFAPLTIMSNDDTDIDSMIATFNTAVTETASEILGKHRQQKKKLTGAMQNS